MDSIQPKKRGKPRRPKTERESLTTAFETRFKEIPPVIAKRAHSNVTVDPDSGCWESNYSRLPTGYATLSLLLSKGNEPRKVSVFLAHRASWTHANGPIPPNMTVHHECFNKACVNPDHLGLMSNVENARRQNGADFPLGQCGNGHPESSRKLYGRKKPVWRCEECMDMWNARTMAKRKAEREAARAA